jgi:hypothetical protein
MPVAKKPKKPGRRANPGEPTVRVDPALKRAYDNLVALISKASAKEAEDFDTRWEAAARIVDHEPPLYGFGGYKSADDFYRRFMNEEPRNARRFMRVAKLASPRDEETYGVSKLDAALAYVEAKLGHPLAHPPLPVQLSRLRIGGLTLDEASVREINAATTKLTSQVHKKPKTPAHTALAAALGKVASLKSVVVREHHGLVTFERVPLAALRHFLRAVSAAKIPGAT